MKFKFKTLITIYDRFALPWTVHVYFSIDQGQMAPGKCPIAFNLKFLSRPLHVGPDSPCKALKSTGFPHSNLSRELKFSYLIYVPPTNNRSIVCS